MSGITRPMLAETYETKFPLKYPVYASPKIDGLRCLVINGRPMSRSFKPIPNLYVQECFKGWSHSAVFDGELVITNGTFRDAQGELRSTHGKPVFEFHMFDIVVGDLRKPFQERIKDFHSYTFPDFARILPQTLIKGPHELEHYYHAELTLGHEGIMLRAPHSPYKCGRSTLKEAYLLKLKPFTDSEAVILGTFEQFSNQNPLYLNELGTTSRSSHQSHLIPKGTLGGFHVCDLSTGATFDIGIGEGWTEAFRAEVWKDRESYLGKVITYKHQVHSDYSKPRTPVALGFRFDLDPHHT